MALLTLLARLQEKHSFVLHLAHVNYALRGVDSDHDEQLVRRMAQRYNLPLAVYRPKSKPVRNVEAALRTLRYAFFERLRKKLNFDVIVTAHTENDLAETLLLNLLRGAGTVGLSALKPQRDRLTRPLLTIARSDIETYLQAEKIPARIDRSNHSVRFTRNRIRHELIPLLQTFNPAIVATLAKTSAHLGQQTAPSPILFLQHGTGPARIITFSRSAFLNLTEAAQRATLYQLFRSCDPTPAAVTERFMNELTQAIRSAKPKRQTVLSRRLSILCYRDRVELNLKALPKRQTVE